MCDSCRCFLPANGHSDTRNLTHEKVQAAGGLEGLSEAQLLAATKTRVGPKTVTEVRKNIRDTEARIHSGKLAKGKR